MLKNRSTPYIGEPIHYQGNNTVSFKIKKSTSIQKYRSLQQQRTTRDSLPQISMRIIAQKQRQTKPQNSLKFIRSRLSRLQASNKILIIDQKTVSELKKNFKVNPVSKILHNNQNRFNDPKRYVAQTKSRIDKIGNATLQKLQKMQLGQKLYAGICAEQLKGWSQKQSIDLQNFYSKQPLKRDHILSQYS